MLNNEIHDEIDDFSDMTSKILKETNQVNNVKSLKAPSLKRLKLEIVKLTLNKKHQKGSNDSHSTHSASQTPKSLGKRAQSLDDQENSCPKRSHLTPFGASSLKILAIYKVVDYYDKSLQSIKQMKTNF
ncbi:hypothetical protein BpHYR1_039517 [Brachionus plicatilis]|uniref:Uncharacterized protein n=1 Tax=Brachionus plicatilis TaxID=10195 RepID=A0A3M7R372_BRAPC|nr:hypothetical protein BpHYR1_039517 [Brachionus plicatilis]